MPMPYAVNELISLEEEEEEEEEDVEYGRCELGPG